MEVGRNLTIREHHLHQEFDEGRDVRSRQKFVGFLVVGTLKSCARGALSSDDGQVQISRNVMRKRADFLGIIVTSHVTVSSVAMLRVCLHCGLFPIEEFIGQASKNHHSRKRRQGGRWCAACDSHCQSKKANGVLTIQTSCSVGRHARVKGARGLVGRRRECGANFRALKSGSDFDEHNLASAARDGPATATQGAARLLPPPPCMESPSN